MKHEAPTWPRALLCAYTYHLFGNRFAAAGFGLGLGILGLAFLMCVSMMGGDWVHVARTYLSDPLHLAFFGVPIVLAVVLGAAGTVKLKREEYGRYWAQKALDQQTQFRKLEEDLRRTVERHYRMSRELAQVAESIENRREEALRAKLLAARDILSKTWVLLIQAKDGLRVTREALRHVRPVLPGFDLMWAERLMQTLDETCKEASAILEEPSLVED